jgi:hypothetical protein
VKLRIYSLFPLMIIGLLGASVEHPEQADGRSWGGTLRSWHK